MAPKAGLSPSAIRDLKTVLSVSGSYYDKILPLYRKSLEHRRFSRGKVKNIKGLRVKISPTQHMTATSVSLISCTLPASPPFRIPQQSIIPLKRPASLVESTVDVGPPSKKLRRLTRTDVTSIGARLLNRVPLLKRLQKSLTLPSCIILRKGRWLLIKQRGLVSPDKPPEFPEHLLTIKVPPGPKLSHSYK